MPGVQNVIGNHKNTIFQHSAAENCTRVNTNSEQGIDCEFRWMKHVSRRRAKRNPQGEGALSETSFQKMCRRMPRVSSASVAERWRRRTRRRIFSSVGAPERLLGEPLGLAFK